MVRALASHARGRGFESLCLHQNEKVPAEGWCFFVLVLREIERARTGRRNALRKKVAGGKLFSPRVASLCLHQNEKVPAEGWCFFVFKKLYPFELNCVII